MFRKRLPARLAALGLATALALGCTTVENPVTGRTERTVMSEQDEIAAGKKLHPQVLAEYGEYRNARVQAYVEQLGQRLARSSHRSNLPWHFTVVDSPEVNAFALPGGYIYVTRGLMAYMESEADLAGVIGHEIGHVTARHAAQRATRQQTAGLGVLAATVLGAILESRGVGGATDVASQMSQTVAAGYLASYSRDQELQADQLGAEYLARATLDPDNMVDVIRVLASQERFANDLAREQGRAPRQQNWLATHPSNEQRLREIREIAQKYRGDYADDGRARYLRTIDGLPFGESREQGLTRGRNFYHEPLGIALTAPEGWSIQNTAERLALVNGAGDAGLVMILAPPQAGSNHEEVIRNVAKPESGQADRQSLNGLAATHFVGTRRNEQGQAVRVEMTVVSGPGNRHFLLVPAAANAQALQRARAGLQQAVASFRPLSAADRAAARPWTLRTVPMPRGGFAELARSSPLPHAERQLRLLNGVYDGGDPPPPGALVKIAQ